MLALAAVNRFRLRPQLASTGKSLALRQLIRNSAIEIAFGLGILVIVAVLGILHPAVHQMDMTTSQSWNGSATMQPLDDTTREYQNHNHFISVEVQPAVSRAEPWSLLNKDVHDAHYAALRQQLVAHHRLSAALAPQLRLVLGHHVWTTIKPMLQQAAWRPGIF